jgi:hypothetical protein
MRTTRTLALVIVAVPLLLGADVYRWVDKDGVVNYTQRKPEGVESARLQAASGPRGATGTADQSPPPAGPGQQVAPSHSALPGEPSPAAVARHRADGCQSARTVLEQFTSRGRVRVREADGTERLLTEDERQERIAHAQRAVTDHCGGTAAR